MCDKVEDKEKFKQLDDDPHVVVDMLAEAKEQLENDIARVGPCKAQHWPATEKQLRDNMKKLEACADHCKTVAEAVKFLKVKQNMERKGVDNKWRYPLRTDDVRRCL